jgi:hypothetical protein
VGDRDESAGADEVMHEAGGGKVKFEAAPSSPASQYELDLVLQMMTIGHK